MYSINACPFNITDGRRTVSTDSASTSASGDSGAVLEAPAVNIDAGYQAGPVYSAVLSPWQEGGEEADTPESVPDVFR